MRKQNNVLVFAFTHSMVVRHLLSSLPNSSTQVAADGAGLAFVVFPRVLDKLNPFFAWIFFFTLFLLGLDSAFAWLHTLVTYTMDWWDESRRRTKEFNGRKCTFFLGTT